MNGIHEKLLLENKEEHREINSKIDKMVDDVTELKIYQTKQTSDMEYLKESAKELKESFKDLNEGFIQDAKQSTTFWRGAAFKIIMALLAASIGGGTVASLGSNFFSTPTAQAQQQEK